ncbi:iron complex transport system substrate-binding protein [Paenibacillus phyllosphaerae]|uniref:Iron complex transport system substrate-binding protein n=1 Tax=Paenibacillus phyllosphaerae TaxID=274593 RepID=A0A7W5B3W6_9BACL|nr:iron-hydroxamate ABC transporter substrate-binding protein [Paenibacillus phyllosphaerae]MBB3113940.1 iron complex transport system substrate-binding protein [Paenibacillus phyllosphaerae]
MKKHLGLLSILACLLILSACGNAANSAPEEANSEEAKSGTITYQSESGPIEVPANPQRVVALSGFPGDVLKLGVNVVGVDSWSKANPTFEEQLKDVQEVSAENLEKIIELEPDLIIGLDSIANIDKLSEIAPTVTFAWGKTDYLTQHLEIGKLLNKEKEAQAWIDDFKQRAQAIGKDVLAKYGDNATVSVIETYDKDIYAFGDHFGRGTEILYHEMGLKMPEKLKELITETGYSTISAEVLPEYAGDFIVISKYSTADNSFQETETYKNIPAVKNGQVFELDGRGASYIDPVTLDMQLEFFKNAFLGN